MHPIPPVTSTAGARGRAPWVTTRDLELLRHLADGLSTARIAAAMSITTNTVRTCIRRLEHRLSVTGRAPSWTAPASTVSSGLPLASALQLDDAGGAGGPEVGPQTPGYRGRHRQAIEDHPSPGRTCRSGHARHAPRSPQHRRCTGTVR
ncbi:helix-turn-helix transcriptional regulator [Geodermatophilus sp. SYSU D00703]